MRLAHSILVATFALATALPAFASDPAKAPTSSGDVVTLTFEVGAETGRIMVALFDGEAAYAGGGEPLASTVVDVAAGQRVARFEGLKSGDYAARMFHDVDGDGQMGTNPFGMPSEPYAFSNNARGNMGPAGWDRAHFVVSGPTAQTIVIR